MADKVTKRMVRDKVQAELLDRLQIKEVQQRCPWTYIVIETFHKNTLYASFGFSKVCWPDKWDAQRGIDIAVERELARLAKEIVAEKIDDAIRDAAEYTIEPMVSLLEVVYELV